MPSKAVASLAGRQGVTAPYADGVGTAATFSIPRGVALSGDDSTTVVVSRAVRALSKLGAAL
jgi:hypothetical protein